MLKRKRNGLSFTECSVKICRILLLSPPYWNWNYHNATQSECAHRLVVNGITLKSAAHQGKWKPKEFWQLIDQKTKKSFILSFLWKLTGSYASSKLISLFSTKDQEGPKEESKTFTKFKELCGNGGQPSTLEVYERSPPSRREAMITRITCHLKA